MIVEGMCVPINKGLIDKRLAQTSVKQDNNSSNFVVLFL